jgi:uncharacterized membrane protein YdfJ with MMPL/SSD domain
MPYQFHYSIESEATMFKAIGQFSDRYRIFLIIGWVTLAVLITLLAPNLDDVVTNDQSDFLPEDASSRVGQELLQTHFPDQALDANIVVVFEADDEGQVLAPENAAYLQEFSTSLLSNEVIKGVQSVQSPTFGPEMAAAFTSQDGQVAMVVVNLDTSDADEQAHIFEALGERLEDAPESLKTYRTGSAAIFTQFDESITRSVERTIFVTIALVIIMLLVIYRSPISPFIPLTVVTLAFLIARGIVAWLAEDTLTVSGTASMLLIVVMYGAGTDYCLFLISRFREEMADSNDSRQSVRRTVRSVGESITSSAGTTTTGFLALALAQLGLFNTTGPTLAIGVIVSLLAGLTLTPAFLGLLGQRTFWPARATHRDSGALYRRTSQLVSSRPLMTIVVIALIMAPFAFIGLSQDANFDFLNDLPDDAESVEGFRVLESAIGPGQMQPINSLAVIGTDDTLSDVEVITQDILAIDGVADVRSASQPLGSAHTQTVNVTRVDRQLQALGALLQPSESTTETTPEQAAFMQNLLVSLPDYLAQIAALQPDLSENAALGATLETLSSQSLDMEQLSDNLFGLSQTVADTHLNIADMPPAVGAAFGGEAVSGLINNYLNGEGAARFEVILSNAPYSQSAMDSVDELNQVFAAHTDKYGVAGTTANNADLREILTEDTRMTFGLVLLGIFIVLMIMLRSVVAPTYLIGTIIFSYTTTLGITRLVSDAVWGTSDLTWWVPFFMFVFLVALGIDYSIFLFGRIKEEVGQHGINEGIHQAVQSTGSIITSAGVIVAGTFGAMMTGEILGLAQIGFAVAIGILIDTFVVRTILDPALAALFGKWTWFPGGVPQPVEKTEPSEAVPSRSIPEMGGAD